MSISKPNEFTCRGEPRGTAKDPMQDPYDTRAHEAQAQKAQAQAKQADQAAQAFYYPGNRAAILVALEKLHVCLLARKLPNRGTL